MRTATFAFVGLIALAGCGPATPSGTTVTGKVSFKGAPISGAMVQFIPTGKDGQPGSGRTDASGVYTLRTPKGVPGVPPGEYRVTISRILGPDGKDLPPDASPFSSPGRESLPPYYSKPEATQLVATVPAGSSATIDFPLGARGGPTGAMR